MDEKTLEKQEWGDASAAMTFIFTMLTMMFWGLYQGIFGGKTELIIGLMQIACFPGYIIGAVIFFKKGDTINGTVFIIFATLFGTLGGFSNIAMHFSNVYGWGLDSTMTSIPFLWGGISLLPVCYIIRKAPVITLSVFVGAAVFLILMSLAALSLLPAVTFIAVKWIMLYVAVMGFYTVIDGLLKAGGCKGLPLGPSILK